MKEVRDEFFKAAESISDHMQQEEEILFPFIRSIALQKDTTQEEKKIIQAELSKLRSDHDIEGDRFKRISQLTNNYEVPSDGCTTYEICMLNLQNFERMLHEHVHLENNILFNQLSAWI